MVGQLRKARLRHSGGQVLERLADPAVEPRTPGGVELLVERLADESMGEAVAPADARHLRDDARGERLLEQLEEPLPGKLGHPRQHLDLEFAAHHRRGGEHAIALRRQAVEAAADHLTDRRGDGDRGGRLPGLLETALGRQ